MTPMKNDDTTRARRQLLADLVAARGQANVARQAQKADRQIADLVAGRVSFGDRLARNLEPLLRPDLPPGWLVFAHPGQPVPAPGAADTDAQTQALAQAIGQELATQAAELGALWIGLDEEERAEILLAIREKAGKAGDESGLKKIKARRRTGRAAGNGTTGES